MTITRETIIYVDLDGVLVDFDGALRERFGFGWDGTPRRKVWSAIMHYNDHTQPWFYSLPKTEDADVLWEFVNAEFDRVEILSASGTSPKDAQGQKRAWIGDHLGYDVVANIVTSGSEKAEFATPNTVLIDDRKRVLNPFIEAGGIGILHTSAADTIEQLQRLREG